jgi:phosphoadenosine phosphosulfate reductase
MIALAFSGGKDSWACLQAHKDDLKDITVLWVNTGKNFPELLKSVELAKSMCPNFIEIKVDIETQIEKYGLPSDIVPCDNTVYGETVTGKVNQLIQPYFQCCYENIGKPLHDKAKELGVTHMIRGDRKDEGHVSTRKHGDVVDGIVQLHPNENMTKQDILNYLESVMDVPPHFYFEHSSLDCYDCSAYLKDTKDISEWSKINHSNLYQKKMIKVNKVKDILMKEMTLGFGD